MLSERRLLKDIKARLRAVLEEVPFIRPKSWKEEVVLPGISRSAQVDLLVDLVVSGKPRRLVVEVKSSGEPRIVRSGIQQLQQLKSPARRAYGVMAAPYMGSETREICKDAGVGFVDLAGNCRLVFDQVFIERLGAPNLTVERRPLRSIFAPKAARVLRVLLEAPQRRWKVLDLSNEAKVSLGLAAKVKQRLLDLEFAREDKEGLFLARSEELIRQWGSSFSYLKSEAMDSYGAGGDVPKLERQLAEYCRQRGVQYGLGLFSGAARVAPFARYTRGFAYVQEDLTRIASDLGWKPVPSGANFTLLRPFDDGIWYGSRDVKGDQVVSDVQLYLDLVSYKGRGEEAANAILEQRLRPRW